MRKIFLTVLVLLTVLNATAQQPERSGRYSREIAARFDNDIFFFIDYYYTAGMEASFRRLLKPGTALHTRLRATPSDSAKVIVNNQIGFKIYNPFNIDFPATSTMDRPYAGYVYTMMDVSNFPNRRAMNYYGAELGLVGEDSKMGQFQRWVHHVTNFEIPKGWDSQIRNEPIVNLYYSRLQEFKVVDDLDLISKTAVKAGTGGNKISQDFTFRLFQFNPLSNSVFTNSRLSWDDRGQGRRRRIETFVVVGYGIDYVITDVFMEGSIFKNHPSVFTVTPQRWVRRRTYGIMFSSRSISWDLTVIHVSREVPGTHTHLYASLGLAVRF